jgi:hypothetical protein
MIRSALAGTALIAGLLISPETAAVAIAAGVQSGAQVTAADAAPFLGDWTLNLQGPNGPGTFDVSVKVDKDKVVGEIANANMATQAITDIVKVDKSLVLRYTFSYEGNPVDAAVSLSPGEEGKLVAQIDFAGGAYVMSGTGVKKEKEKPKE